MAERILLIDDEDAIRRLVAFHLERAGFEVLLASDGETGLLLAVREQPDLVVLDIMLPDASGFDLIHQLKQTCSAPVIFLTARAEEFDRVFGLEVGADDYLVKPFSPRELVARVRVVLRRHQDAEKREGPGPLRFGELTIDNERHEVRAAGVVVPLTPTEFSLLSYLAEHAGVAISRDRLLSAVWGDDYFGDSRIVDVHVRHLREKVERDPSRPRHIRTVRGVGYRFDAEEAT